MPKDLFYFNHIDPAINEEKLKELKESYKYYHKLWWCYKKAARQFKQAYFAINLASVGLITSGTIAGAITLNPIIIGVITGLGLFVKTTSEIKKYANKIELFKLGLTTYEKILVDLRSFFRGEEYSYEEFIRKMNFVDCGIVDLCTIPEKIERKYEKKNSKIFHMGN